MSAAPSKNYELFTRIAQISQNYAMHYNMREGKDYKIQSSTVEIPNKFIRTSRSTVSADIPLESVHILAKHVIWMFVDEICHIIDVTIN